VLDFFRDEEIRNSITCTICCAIDPVGAWGIVEVMRKQQIEVQLVSGPVTDNIVGIDFVRKTLGLRGINAINQKEELGSFVEELVGESIEGRRGK